jgi:enoyl-CoA hydratase/carnithine racemase
VPDLNREGDVFVLRLGDDENRFNPDWIASVREQLAVVLATPAPRALVTTATGKFWSNGLDLEWLGAHADQIESFVGQVHGLFAEVLEAGVPTVAAIQGHAFAAGAMLAMAHDQRVMRRDRGYFCVPEVDISIPFTPGMTALLSARLPGATAHEAMTTGRRYGGPDALAAGIVDELADEGDLLARAIERAGALAAKDPATLGTIKQRLYADTLTALRAPQGL